MHYKIRICLFVACFGHIFTEQTIAGVTLPAGASETSSNSFLLAGGFAYALHDRFNLGLSLLYLASQSNSTHATGSLSSLNVTSTSTGIYNPRITAIGRLLGLGADDWFLDIEAMFLPGIKSNDRKAFAYPNDETGVQIRFGKNSGN